MSEDAKVVRLASPDDVTPKQSPILTELGVPGNLPFGAFDDSAIIPEQPVPVEELIKMRRSDGQVRALVRLMTLPILSALHEASYVPDDGGDAEAEFIEQVFSLPPQVGGMTTPLSKFMRQLLLALVEGFSAFEKCWHVPDRGPLAGKITLRKMAYRTSSTVKFRVDDKGGFNGFRQVAQHNNRSIDVIIPRQKAFYFAANEEENPFYGVSFFLPAYYHYDKKVKLYYIAHIAAQFAAVAGRLGFVPADADDTVKAAFKKALESFGFNTAMLVPENYDVKPFESKSTFPFLEIIDHHNNQMSKSVLGGFIDDAQQRSTIVDFSSGKDDMFVLGLMSIMDEIADKINFHVIPELIDWNFGSSKYPQFRFGTLADSTRDALKEVFSGLTGAKDAPWTKEFIHETEKKMAERLELEIDYDELDKVWETEAEEEREVEAATRKASIELAKNPQPPTAAKPGEDPKEKVAASATDSGGFISLDVLTERVATFLENRDT